MTLQLDKTPVGLVDRAIKKLSRKIRDVKRKSLRGRFLSLPAPSYCIIDKYEFQVHMLLCQRDLEMGICAAMSLLLVAEGRVQFIFHEDGSLQEHDFNKLSRRFPACKIISRSEADKQIVINYHPYTEILEWRRTFPLALKIIDVFEFSENQRVLFMDPDILFFKAPHQFLSMEQQGNLFNKDIETAYIANPNILSDTFQVNVLAKINSGLWSVKADDFAFKKIALFLSDKFWILQKNRFHVAEQTLFALAAAAAKNPVDYFYPEYDVDYFKSVEHAVCKHYVGRIRHGFETEGLNYLLTELSFEKRWCNWIYKLNSK